MRSERKGIRRMNPERRQQQIRAIREELERLKQAINRLINIFRKGSANEKDHKTASDGEVNRIDPDV